MSSTRARHTIELLDWYGGAFGVFFGIEASGPASEYPLLVGCSLSRGADSTVVDVPARWLRSPGKAVWWVRMREEFYQDAAFPYWGWSGSVIFALYRDESFAERLSYTDWAPWNAKWTGWPPKEGEWVQANLKYKYGERLDVWSDDRNDMDEAALMQS